MNDRSWFQRLREQLPGWKVWRAGVGPDGEGWFAVPAPSGTVLDDALRMPHRLGPYRRPQDLRMAAQERYGWYAHCDTCGASWLHCGHRSPERERR